MEKKSIVQWCKEQHEAGKELSMHWEGGGDSGWVHFEIDGDSVDNEYTRALVDEMYTTLDYGSWAGEFNASGKAIYNPETSSFTGIDNYGEDAEDTINSEIIIKVPNKFWFTSLHIEVESDYDETPKVDVKFIVKNGFLSEEHTAFCSTLEQELKNKFEFYFSSYESSNGDEFRNCTDAWLLDRNTAVIDGDDLVFKIEQLQINIMTSEEKGIMLTLDSDMAESIDEHLNNENEN